MPPYLQATGSPWGSPAVFALKAPVTKQTYNAADQVEGWSYDAAGNLLSDGTITTTYDTYNRLLQTEGAGEVNKIYLHNGDGALVVQFDATVDTATEFTQDLAAPLPQILQAKLDSDNSTTTYLYGLERLASVSGTTRTWYGTDALGSVRLTMDDTGVPLQSYRYDP